MQVLYSIILLLATQRYLPGPLCRDASFAKTWVTDKKGVTHTPL